jgi:hypothetical protein
VDATVGIESDLHASLEGKVQVRLLGKLWDTKLFGFPLYTARTSLWEKSYSMVVTEGCRAAEIVNVTYPVAECPAPLVYDTLARCVPKPLCENPPCKARVAVQVKWPSTGTDLVHLKWVWSRDRTVFLEKEVLFERSPTELCQFPEAPPHSRLRCAVIRETFEGIEPGEVDFTVWDQDRYNLITKGAAYIPPRTIVQFRCRYPGDHYACETVSEALP